MAKRNKQTLRRIYTGREIVDSPLATCYNRVHRGGGD